MGIVYVGPYADDVNHDAYHEGYAARLWPDGTLTSSWVGEHGSTGHIGLVGACECGWRSQTVHPAGDLDGPEHQAAKRDFETEHLDPLVEQARQRSWPLWARRVTTRAHEITHLVQAGRPGDANRILNHLRDDVDHRSTVLADLVDEQQPTVDHEPRAKVFPQLTVDDRAAAPPAVPATNNTANGRRR